MTNGLFNAKQNGGIFSTILLRSFWILSILFPNFSPFVSGCGFGCSPLYGYIGFGPQSYGSYGTTYYQQQPSPSSYYYSSPYASAAAVHHVVHHVVPGQQLTVASAGLPTAPCDYLGISTACGVQQSNLPVLSAAAATVPFIDSSYTQQQVPPHQLLPPLPRVQLPNIPANSRSRGSHKVRHSYNHEKTRAGHSNLRYSQEQHAEWNIEPAGAAPSPTWSLPAVVPPFPPSASPFNTGGIGYGNYVPAERNPSTMAVAPPQSVYDLPRRETMPMAPPHIPYSEINNINRMQNSPPTYFQQHQPNKVSLPSSVHENYLPNRFYDQNRNFYF